MKTKKKVLINISDGMIQEITTNDPNVEIMVYDWDTIEEGGGPYVSNSSDVVTDKKIQKILKGWDELVEEYHDKVDEEDEDDEEEDEDDE